MEFKFKLCEEEAVNAKRLGLPTEYEVKPHANSERVEIWYYEDGEDRYALYDKRIVEDKLNRGVWIKLKDEGAVVVFTNDEDGCYVEGISTSLETAKKLWIIEKVIDGRSMGGWRDIQAELKRPTVGLNCHFAFIQSLD